MLWRRFLLTALSFGDVFWEVTSIILVVRGEKGDLEYREAKMAADMMRLVYGFLNGLPQQLLELFIVSRLNCITPLQIVRICTLLTLELMSFVRTPHEYLKLPNRKDHPLAPIIRPKFAFESVIRPFSPYIWATFFFFLLLFMAAGPCLTITFFAGRVKQHVWATVFILLPTLFLFIFNLVLLLRDVARWKRAGCALLSAIFCAASTVFFCVVAIAWVHILSKEAGEPPPPFSSASPSSPSAFSSSTATDSPTSTLFTSNWTPSNSTFSTPSTLTSTHLTPSTSASNGTEIVTQTTASESPTKITTSTTALASSTEARTSNFPTTLTSVPSSPRLYQDMDDNDEIHATNSMCFFQSLNATFIDPFEWGADFAELFTRSEEYSISNCSECRSPTKFNSSGKIDAIINLATQSRWPITGGMKTTFWTMFIANILHFSIFAVFVFYCAVMRVNLSDTDDGSLALHALDGGTSAQFEMNVYQ